MSPGARARALLMPTTTPECFAAPLRSRLLPSVRKVEAKPGDLRGTLSPGGCKQRAKYAEGFGFGGRGFARHTKPLRQSLLIVLQLPPTVARRGENTQPAGGDFASAPFHLPALRGESQHGAESVPLAQPIRCLRGTDKGVGAFSTTCDCIATVCWCGTHI